MEDHALISAAEVFSHHKKMDALEPILVQREARPRKANDYSQLTGWLRDFYKERKDWAKTFDYTLKLFNAHASLESYEAVETYARKLKRWDQLRPELLAQLAAGKDTRLLIEIYLRDKDFDAAVKLASEMTPTYFDVYGDIRLKVAAAVEVSHPRFALERYRPEIDRIVSQRNRGSYDVACRYLLKVKKLYAGLGEAHVWDAYFVNMRENTRQMRAFQDELRKVKLV